jgi:hypothetical protein
VNECQKHWDALRAKVESLGLSHLVASTDEEAFDRSMRHIEALAEGSLPDEKDFDPLMAMSAAIFNRVLAQLGVALLAPDESGNPRCPLCVVRFGFDKHSTPSGRCSDPRCSITVTPGERPWDEIWVEQCGEQLFGEAVRRGLVSRQ